MKTMKTVSILRVDGKAVRKAREKAGFGLREFARLTGMDPGHISRIENGKTAGNMRIGTLARISQRLGVKRESLLRRAAARPR